MTQLNFPSPSESPWKGPNGVTYTWVVDGGDGYWSAVPQASDFLKLDASNSPVTGPLTFEDRTTHENGIYSTNVRSLDGKNNILVNDGTKASAVSIGAGELTPGSQGVRAILANVSISSSLTADISAIQANLESNITTTGNVFGFSFTKSSTSALDIDGDIRAFNCGINQNQNTGSGNVYTLYSGGTAASYHNGDFRIGSSSMNANPAETLGQGNTNQGTKFFSDAGATLNSNKSTTLSIANNGSGTSNRLINFWVGGNSGVCGKFYALSASTMALDVGNGGSLINTSDYRAKSNINELESSVDLVKALRPVAFNYTEDQSKTHVGFVAHELQELVPNAVVGEKDAVDEEGNPLYQGADVTKLIPILTKALQEALERIEALENA